MRKIRRYTDAEKAFLAQFIPGHSYREIADEFNKHFSPAIDTSKVHSYTRNNHISTGLTGRYEKGHVPMNKGTKGLTCANITSFKTGNTPANYRPIGSERVDSKDGYTWIKVCDDMPVGGDWRDLWKMKHRVIWEEKNGPIPDGSVLVFCDGNRENVCLENLMLISKAENCVINNKRLEHVSRETTELCLTTARLHSAVASAVKKLRKKI